MSDVATPAAAPTTAPATSTPSSAPAAAPAAKPSAPTNGTPSARARLNNGQFAAKDGAANPPADGETPPGPNATEAEKEAYRFRRKLKVYGKEEDVDLDEDGIARELQIKRALERKVRDFQGGYEKAQRLIELAEKDPEGFLRQLKHDPDELARRRLAKQAQLEAMTPEERELQELREYRASKEKEAVEAAERQKHEQRERLKQNLVQQNNQRFLHALKSSDLPQTYESLYYLAETARLGLEDGISYSDAELAKETARRLDTLTDRYLGQLDGKALVKKLGPKRVQAVLAAAVAEFEAKQNFEQPVQTSAPASSQADEPEVIDSAEVERRFRAMRNGGR